MELEEEIRELERRFSEFPDSRLFLPLADALRRAGELERAIKLCRDGLERFPEFTSARVLLGECLRELGRLDEAEKVLEEVRATDSQNLRVLKNLADMASKRGEEEKARQLSHRIRELEETESLGERGVETPSAQEQTLQSVEASGDFSLEEMKEEPALEAAPESKAAHQEEMNFDAQGPGEMFLTHTLADIYRLQGHYEQAYEIYRKLLEDNREDPVLRKKIEEVSSYLDSAETPEEAGELHLPEKNGLKGSAPLQEEPLKEAFWEDEKLANKGVAATQEITQGKRISREESPVELSEDMTQGIEKRIDGIFRFLLGDEFSGPDEQIVLDSGFDSPAEPDKFLEMLENWISSLKPADAP